MTVHEQLLELRVLRLRAHLEPHTLTPHELTVAKNDVLLAQLHLEAAVEDLLDDLTAPVADVLELLAERIARRWRERRAARLMRGRNRRPVGVVDAARKGDASVGQQRRSTPQGIGAGHPDANTAATPAGLQDRSAR